MKRPIPYHMPNIIFKSILFSIVLMSMTDGIAQTQTAPKHNTGLVNWMTIEEAEEKMKTDPKPVVMDIYTDWCGWCKRMMATTYTDPQVSSYINTNFYPVMFNAETSDTVIFQGKTYTNPNPGAKRSTHDLIRKLFRTSGYPTTFFAGANFNQIRGVSGYLEANGIAPYLIYYNENLINTVAVEEFTALFDQTFKPKTSTSKVNWVNPQSLFNTEETNKKKLLFLTSEFKMSSKVMDSTTFLDTTANSYINQNFIASRLEITSSDTLIYNGQATVNNPADGPYHQLVNAFMNNKTVAPAVVILDSNNSLITAVPQFIPPSLMPAILVFFNEEKYKEQTFQEFRSSFEGI